MPGREYNVEILATVNTVKSTDKDFQEIQQKIRDYYNKNDEYYNGLETGKDKNGEQFLESFEDNRNILRSIKLRNDINKYLETNKSKMTSVEYQSVVQAYDNLVKKFDEDFKGIEGEKIFDTYKEALNEQLLLPVDEVNVETVSRTMAARYYMTALKREYMTADEASKTGSEEEKEAANKWKNNIIKKLYSGTLDDDIDRFVKEDEIGKTVYNYCKNHITYDHSSRGLNYSDIKRYDELISSELQKIVLDKENQANNIKIEGEADKQKALDIIYEAERIRDVGNATAGSVATPVIKTDTKKIIVRRNLVGKINDKLAEVKLRMRDYYNEQAKAEMDAQMAEHDKRLEEARKAHARADQNYRDAQQEVNVQEARYKKAKSNYDMLNKIGFIDEDDRKANEGVYQRELKLLNDLKDKLGSATSEASRKSMEVERLTNEKRVMQENAKKVYEEKCRNNPFEPKSNLLEEQGIFKPVEKELQSGGKVTIDELAHPNDVKAHRLSQMFKCLKVLQPGELPELLKIEEENHAFLTKIESDMPARKTVEDVIEPGLLALEERNRQLSQNAPKPEVEENQVEENLVEENPVEEEKPIEENKEEQKVEDKKEEQPGEQEEELQEESINIDEAALAEEYQGTSEREFDTPLYGATHEHLVGLSAGVASLYAATKGVWGGSREYSNIAESLKAINELEQHRENNADSHENNAESLENSELYAERETLLAAKKQLAVQMKHYIARKNEEKEAAEAGGKQEKKNSAFRRETMENVLGLLEEHIQADEQSMGIDKRDKTFENLSNELHYIKDNIKSNKELTALIRKVDQLEKDTPENLPSEERIRRSQEIVNDMQKLSYKFRKEKLGKNVSALLENFGEHYLRDIAEYKPDQLAEEKTRLSNMNGVRINTDVKRADSTFNSYDDMKMYQQRQIQDSVNAIFKEEAGKKNFVSEWALYDEVEKEYSYEYIPSDKENVIEKNITASALKCIYADQQKNANVIFDPKTINTKADEFVKGMSGFKAFNNKFKKHLCSGLKSVENSNNPQVVDMSMDTINICKNAAFQETLVSELGKLTTKLNEGKSKEEIQNSLDSLNNLDKLSRLVGTQDVYKNKIKVNGKEIELKELNDLAVQKAQKKVASAKGPQKNNKEPEKKVVKGSAPKK